MSGTQWTDEDISRLGAFLSAGIEGERAEALVALVRSIEENDDAGVRVRQKAALLDRLAGVPAYVAYSALFCHASEHEPFGAIGSAYLSQKEAKLGNDPESY